MSNSKPYIRTDTDSPKLDMQMSWWGMEGLEESRLAQSVEARVALIAEVGFDGINGLLPSPEEEDRWRRLLERYGLSFSVNAYPKTAEDMERFLARAKEFGRVQHINVQVMTPFLIGEPALDLLRELDRLSGEEGIPAYIETHRGTITQDLLRTVGYLAKLESLRLTVDLSHYVLAGEMQAPARGTFCRSGSSSVPRLTRSPWMDLREERTKSAIAGSSRSCFCGRPRGCGRKRNSDQGNPADGRTAAHSSERGTGGAILAL